MSRPPVLVSPSITNVSVADGAKLSSNKVTHAENVSRCVSQEVAEPPDIERRKRRTNEKEERTAVKVAFSRNRRMSCVPPATWQPLSLTLRLLIAIPSILDPRLPPLAILSDLSADGFRNFYLVAVPAGSTSRHRH
ncbi:hypothetical protein K0M31_011984 [Melipona bicolor]|uniref:Uncharacterized protein n=1 Tax=Melipona bicolor TaxID=60889 RepID=A0AA40GBU9_9HYME|nr:hypothetical protein K0M31_011984 [Melipona bicolor]